MKILYLPLDSRPCNSAWPYELIDGSGHELISPAPECMDYFKTPSSFEKTKEFLLKNLENADAAVISVDHLCYGSLIASRDLAVSDAEALKRLEMLRQIKTQRPNLPIHAFGVILRSTISALCKGDFEAYMNMSNLSLCAGRAERCAEQGFKSAEKKYLKQAEIYRQKLDKSLYENYIAVRRRNHAVNMECVKMAGEGVIDSLLLLQEDCGKYGFQTAEQRALSDAARELDLKNVYIHNGADEGGMAAIVRAITKGKTPVRTLYSSGSGGFWPRYEDRRFKDNLSDYMSYLSIEQNNLAGSSLVIHAPDGKQCEAEEQSTHLVRFEKTLSLIKGELEKGKRVYLLDVAYANGGDVNLIKRLQEAGMLFKLSGYSAWNTTCNSMGTILAQIVTDEAFGRNNPAFCAERVLDDALYQSVIRKWVRIELEARGEDAWCLSEKASTEALIREKFENELYGASELSNIGSVINENYEMSINLPWDRVFEADIRLKPR